MNAAQARRCPKCQRVAAICVAAALYRDSLAWIRGKSPQWRCGLADLPGLLADEYLLHPAAAARGFDFDEAILLFTHHDHLVALAERRDSCARLGRR